MPPETDEDGIERWQSHFGQLGYFVDGDHATRAVGFSAMPDDVPTLGFNPKTSHFFDQPDVAIEFTVQTFWPAADGHRAEEWGRGRDVGLCSPHPEPTD